MPDPDTNRLLGELKGAVDAMQRQQDAEAAKASASRARVHQQLEEIRAEAQRTRTRTETLERVMDSEVRPVVRGVLDWRSRGIGALAVLGLVGTALMVLVTSAWEMIMEAWRGIIGR
mgnify:CR=1 FL=1